MNEEIVKPTTDAGNGPRWLFLLNIVAAVISIIGFPLGIFFWMFPPAERVPWMLIVLMLAVMALVLLVASVCLHFRFQSKLHASLLKAEQEKCRQFKEDHNRVLQQQEKAASSEKESLEKKYQQEAAKLAAEIGAVTSKLNDELSARQKNRCRHLEAFHKLVHDVRDISHGSLMGKRPLGDDVIANLFEEMVVSVLDNTRDLFRTYFQSTGRDIGDDVSVALKLRVPREELSGYLSNFSAEDFAEMLGGEVSALITFARDSHTRRMLPEREVRGRPYSMKANTAFDQILTGGSKAAKKACFANDDLRKAYGDAVYHNQNETWFENYNSTIAVAVRFKAPGLMPYGFLCIDSKNEEKLALYQGDEVYHIASHAADLLAVLILGVTLFKDWAGVRMGKQISRRKKHEI